MKVCGFTIVRNAVKFDYPIKEAILSVLPLVDQFIVLVGNSEDNTLELIESIQDPKIQIHHSTWDDSLREGGKVLAVETNKAKALIPREFDWCFYIQGDEVIHERDYPAIRETLLKAHSNPKVEGVVFNYRHFYGSYNYIGNSRKWYKNEVRLIRNDDEIYSFRDAQGFQKKGRPLRVYATKGFVNHYGWVKPPEIQQEKQKSFHKMWHDDQWVEEKVGDLPEFDYSQIDSLALYKDTHPSVMKERIANQNWSFKFDIQQKNLSLKSKLLLFIEKTTGWSIVYKNYKIVK